MPLNPEADPSRPPQALPLFSRLGIALRRVFGKVQQPPGWRAVFITAGLALAAGVAIAFVVWLSPDYRPNWAVLLPDWAVELLALAFITFIGFFPLVVRGIGPWLRASVTGFVLHVGGFGADKLLKASDSVISLVLIVAIPLSLTIGLRHGATPWRRVLMGTGGGIVGCLAVVSVFDFLERLVVGLVSNPLQFTVGASICFLLAWVPVALADLWFGSVVSERARRLHASTSHDASAMLLVPSMPFRRIAAVLFAMTMLLPWIIVVARTRVQASALPASRSAARPEMLVVPPDNLAVATTEITRRQFKLVMGYDPSAAPHDPELPVESVTVREAMDYCDRLSSLEGLPGCYISSSPYRISVDDCLGYRLPTVVEWEGTIQRGAAKDAEHAWLRENAEGRTHAVASKRADTRGFRDVFGNVAEFVLEGMNINRSEPNVGLPIFVTYAGASWQDDATELSHLMREISYKRSPAVGFRIVRTVKRQVPQPPNSSGEEPYPPSQAENNTSTNTRFSIAIYSLAASPDRDYQARSHLQNQGYTIMQQGGWLKNRIEHLAQRSTVFYYDERNVERANSIARGLAQVTGRQFVALIGAGEGVPPGQESWIFIVHYIEK
jgi:formylglycine-generating enzyme required for sulfatase activity